MGLVLQAGAKFVMPDVSAVVYDRAKLRGRAMDVEDPLPRITKLVSSGDGDKFDFMSRQRRERGLVCFLPGDLKGGEELVVTAIAVDGSCIRADRV